MASNSSLLMEDQTDEDFFDRLMEDDSDTEPNQVSTSSTSVVKLLEEQTSDAAETFANLNIGDDSKEGDRLPEAKLENDTAAVDTADNLEFRSEYEESKSGTVDASVQETVSQSKRSESGDSGVKVVGWGSFCADASESGTTGFGSDFFSELEGNGQSFYGEVDQNVNALETVFLGEAEDKTSGLSDSAYVEQQQNFQGNNYVATLAANEQDFYRSIQYWESVCPGWKYDLNTGHWYQAGSYEDSTDELSNEKSKLAYSSPISQPAAGTQLESSTMENVSGWAQCDGYPKHFFFNPCYPGWYFDSISQEFRALQSYNVDDTAGGHEQLIQNGHALGALSCENSGGNYIENGQTFTKSSQNLREESQQKTWNFSYVQQSTDMWHQGNESKSTAEFANPNFRNPQNLSFYSDEDSQNNHVSQQVAATFCDVTTNSHFDTSGVAGSPMFIPSSGLPQQFTQQDASTSFTGNFLGNEETVNVLQQSFESSQKFSYDPSVGRSPDGRPPHALVSFGFGGKIIVMKGCSSFQNSLYEGQDPLRSSLSIFNLMEFVTGNTNASIPGSDDYFQALGQQSIPGPLAGGSIGTKDVYKWIDEKISFCRSASADFSRGEHLSLLLSLLKISCQHYGKLRSPFGSDTTLKEKDTADAAVANLFASVKRRNGNFGHYATNECLQNLPSEATLKVTAFEVQNLLVSGKKLEALQCAQEGQLWGAALVLATQLGDQFYIDTVKQMAIHQLVAGTPLRTLCLLIAGQPAEVFSAGISSDNSFPGTGHLPQQNAQLGASNMLDEWEENLAVITVNRTKDDELVITHLGDCLWKEKSKIVAAHICYLLAEKNLEPYSDSARLCLLGVDHWRFPRTYACPEAIQMTELYEYSKVLGNSQYIMLPFQPYKLVYAHMLSEVGRVSEALKYCQAILKSPKIGRAQELETWKQMASLLEERIRIHQESGFANLAPAKLVGKLLNFFDNTAHRVVGGLPPPAPSTSFGHVQASDNHNQLMAPRESKSQSTMAMSSLMPSASMEPISDVASGNKMMMHHRSVSEPDFVRKPEQGYRNTKEGTTNNTQNKASDAAAGSRFGRLGSGLLRKTVGLVLWPRQSRQAKLGEANKFYYDEKLKRWVEEGAEPPAEEAALPPPPTTAMIQNDNANYVNQFGTEARMPPTGGKQNMSSPITSQISPGIPPTPGSSNQFSARGRMGVRSRYVDTFNAGRAATTNTRHSTSLPSVKPPVAANAKIFVPSAPSDDVALEAKVESAQDEGSANESTPISTAGKPIQASSPVTMQRFPSMDNIKRPRASSNTNHSHLAPSRRTASWSGSFSPPENAESNLGSDIGMSSSHLMHSSRSGSSLGEDLQEVEL